MRAARLLAALLVAASALAALQAEALAAPRPQRVTPGKLWSLYPLDNGAHLDRTRTAPARPTPRPKPAPVRIERSFASRPPAKDNDFPALWVGGGAIVVLGLLAGGLAVGVARTRAQADVPAAAAPPPEAPPPPPPEEPAAIDRNAALTAERREVEEESPRREAAPEKSRTAVREITPHFVVPPAPPRPMCQIDLWHGYVKTSFVAMAAGFEGPTLIAESRLFRARGELHENEAAAQALGALVDDLLAHGWERDGQGEEWYALRFVRTNTARATP
jgi:hypothetical protein